MDLNTPTVCLTSYMGYFAERFIFSNSSPTERESLERFTLDLTACGLEFCGRRRNWVKALV